MPGTIRLRDEVGAPAELQGLLAERPSWIRGWLGVRPKPSHAWRIKL